MPETINYLEKVDAMVGLRGLTKGTHQMFFLLSWPFFLHE